MLWCVSVCARIQCRCFESVCTVCVWMSDSVSQREAPVLCFTSQQIVCVHVRVCACCEWAAYQSRCKEHSQQSQAGSHHYEQQENNQGMLLAHTVVGLVQPILGPDTLLLSPSSSFIPFIRLPCPVQDILLPPDCLLPHGSWSRKGGRGWRKTTGGGGCGYCQGIGSFHHRCRAVALFHFPAVAVPVGDHSVRCPNLQCVLWFLLRLVSEVLQADTTESCGWVRGSVRWPQGWQERTEGRAQHPPLSPPANMLKR